VNFLFQVFFFFCKIGEFLLDGKKKKKKNHIFFSKKNLKKLAKTFATKKIIA
jgi:hypothetical protein